jgi:hypothetical protein
MPVRATRAPSLLPPNIVRVAEVGIGDFAEFVHVHGVAARLWRPLVGRAVLEPHDVYLGVISRAMGGLWDRELRPGVA